MPVERVFACYELTVTLKTLPAVCFGYWLIRPASALKTASQEESSFFSANNILSKLDTKQATKLTAEKG